MSKQHLPVADLQTLACCPPLVASPLDAEQATAVAPMFKALGDPVRLRLMSLIASRAEVCVCELTAAFEVSGPTISHHLKVLREAGLVSSERRATWVWYRVRPEALRQLGALLTVATAGDRPTEAASAGRPGR